MVHKEHVLKNHSFKEIEDFQPMGWEFFLYLYFLSQIPLRQYFFID